MPVGKRLTADEKACIWAMLNIKISAKTIATTVGILEREAYRYQRAYRMTGNPFPETRSRFNSVKITPFIMESLLDLLTYKPDLYLDEMRWFLALEHNCYVTESAISKRLKKDGWTKKKLYLRAKQQSEALRDDWIRKLGDFTAEMIVFCDESGLDRRNGARRTGWAPLGVAPAAESTLTRGRRFHLLPAISVNGLLHRLVYKGHTTTEGFLDWLERGLLPKMNRFPGPDSILVMDNASWHKDPQVDALCRRFGVMLLYLPPYSPDFNPIEAYFKDLKTLIRRHYQYTGGDAVLEDVFVAFLEQSADIRGNEIEAIRGHYRQALVTWREGWYPGQEVNYTGLYAEALEKWLAGEPR
ncbi:hypothetical protein RB597_005053 [Gaeumannomyces tritici]